MKMIYLLGIGMCPELADPSSSQLRFSYPTMTKDELTEDDERLLKVLKKGPLRSALSDDDQDDQENPYNIDTTNDER